jgi:integrase
MSHFTQNQSNIIPFSPLKAASIQPSTLKAYNDNVKQFLLFWNFSSVSKLHRLSLRKIDSLLSSYFNYSYSIGGSYAYACHTLNGLCFHYPAIRGALHESNRCLKGWRKKRKSRSHPPITWELTMLIAVILLKSGFYSESIGVLLSFDCYLRVGELLSLTYNDVAKPNDPRLGSAHRQMALRLAKTKTGLNQWVTVSDPDVAVLFHEYLLSSSLKGADVVFPFSRTRFRSLLRSVVSALGLSRIKYVPHSFSPRWSHS